MTRIWFTSDQHFSHKNIIRYSGRPFASVDEMNQELVARFNAVVEPGDLVWHLGDFSLAQRLVPFYLEKLNGRHRLVAGNHDSCHSSKRAHHRAIAAYLDAGFLSVSEREVIEVPELGEVLLTHMPRGSYEGVRYPKHRPNDWSGWIFHGHIHERWRRSGNQINVGVDVWGYAPVLLEQLIEEARSGVVAV